MANATPKCPKCGNEFFEVQPINVVFTRFPLNAVNCSQCGTILGILESENVNENLRTLAIKLGHSLDF